MKIITIHNVIISYEKLGPVVQSTARINYNLGRTPPLPVCNIDQKQ